MSAIPAEVLESLSDDDLGKISQAKDVGSALGSLSDDGLKKIASYKAPKASSTSRDPGLASDIGVKVGEGLMFGARPFVAGVGGGIGESIGMMERDIPLAERLRNLPGAFAKGFGEERALAQAEEADVSARRPGLSTAIGVGTALATAPLLAGRAVQAAKAGGLLSGVGQAARIGAGLGAAQALGHADSSGEAIETIGGGAALGGALQFGGNAAVKAAPAIGRVLGRGAKKIGSALTGISEQEIQTYASRADEVKALIAKSGGDIAEAADQIRSGIGRDIQVARQKLGNQIGAALDDPKYAGVIIDARPIIHKLDEMIGSVSKTAAKFRPDEINELKNVRDVVFSSVDDGFKINLKTLSEIKEELQAIAKPSYNNGALIFPKGDLAAKASKAAAGEARRLLNAAAPEIKVANEQLSRLHRIEDVINKNLIREGKSEAALIAAGSGGNPRNAKLLSGIDQITGGQSVRQAENLAAARSFGNPALLPADFTGKSAARILSGAGAGTIMGGPVGGAIGAAATSPAALKLTIDTGRFLNRLGRATGAGMSKMLPAAPAGSGRAAVMSGAVKETTAGERHAETAVERRLRELKKKGSIKSDAG